MPEGAVLTVREVEKRFEGVTAVDGLSFEVSAGEIFALLGPNGAGKTTTVRMLTGIIAPDRGAIDYAFPGRGAAVPTPLELGCCSCRFFRSASAPWRCS
jgi:ABC-type branched-subunit amino acid transport system ATPase component